MLPCDTFLILLCDEQTSDVSSLSTEEVCLDDVPDDHSLLNVKKLADEGLQAFNTVLAYQSSAHISRSTLI